MLLSDEFAESLGRYLRAMTSCCLVVPLLVSGSEAAGFQQTIPGSDIVKTPYNRQQINRRHSNKNLSSSNKKHDHDLNDHSRVAVFVRRPMRDPQHLKSILMAADVLTLTRF